MKAILDEGVPRQLIAALGRLDCVVHRFPHEWKGLKNGQLLDRLEANGFDCLLTCDKNMQWQQSLTRRQIAILVLPTQDLAKLKNMATDIAAAVYAAKAGQANHVSLPQSLR